MTIKQRADHAAIQYSGKASYFFCGFHSAATSPFFESYEYADHPGSPVRTQHACSGRTFPEGPALFILGSLLGAPGSRALPSRSYAPFESTPGYGRIFGPM